MAACNWLQLYQICGKAVLVRFMTDFKAQPHRLATSSSQSPLASIFIEDEATPQQAPAWPIAGKTMLLSHLQPWLCPNDGIVCKPAMADAEFARLLATQPTGHSVLATMTKHCQNSSISGKELETQHASIGTVTFASEWLRSRRDGTFASKSFLGSGLCAYIAQAVVRAGPTQATDLTDELPQLASILKLPSGLEHGHTDLSQDAKQASNCTAAQPPCPPYSNARCHQPAVAHKSCKFELHSVTAWINAHAAASQTHYDEHHNVLACLFGQKRVWMAPPSALLHVTGTSDEDIAEAVHVRHRASAAAVQTHQALTDRLSPSSVVHERCNAWPGQQLWDVLPPQDVDAVFMSGMRQQVSAHPGAAEGSARNDSKPVPGGASASGTSASAASIEGYVCSGFSIGPKSTDGLEHSCIARFESTQQQGTCFADGGSGTAAGLTTGAPPVLFVADVCAGCSVYIPPGWWHCVTSEPGTAALNVWADCVSSSCSSSGAQLGRDRSASSCHSSFAECWLHQQHFDHSAHPSVSPATHHCPPCGEAKRGEQQPRTPPTQLLPTRRAVAAAAQVICPSTQSPASTGAARSGDVTSPSRRARHAAASLIQLPPPNTASAGEAQQLDSALLGARAAARHLVLAALNQWEADFKQRSKLETSGLFPAAVPADRSVLDISSALLAWEVGASAEVDAQYEYLTGLCSGLQLLEVLQHLLHQSQSARAVLWALRWSDETCLFVWRALDGLTSSADQAAVQAALAALDRTAAAHPVSRSPGPALATAAVSSRLAQGATAARSSIALRTLSSGLGLVCQG